MSEFHNHNENSDATLSNISPIPFNINEDNNKDIVLKSNNKYSTSDISNNSSVINSRNSCVGTPEQILNTSSNINESMEKEEEESIDNNQSNDNTVNNNNEVNETEKQRLEREDRESQELAWEMIRQEQEEMYRAQMQFMEEHGEELSAEDRALIENLVAESNQANDMVVASTRLASNTNNNNANEEEEGEEEESEEWDYQRLLDLEAEIGDVRTERWRLRSDAVLKSLPTLQYSQLISENTTTNNGSTDALSSDANNSRATSSNEKNEVINTVFLINNNDTVTSPTNTNNNNNTKDNNSSNKKQCIRVDSNNNNATTAATTAFASSGDRCVVCMDDFSSDDTVTLLPCKHYFHFDCTKGWIKDHNSCPYCKTAIEQSP